MQQSPSKKLGEHGYKYIPVGSTPKNIHILKRLNLMTFNVGDSFLRVKDRPCQVKIEDNDLAAALVAAVLGILRAQELQVMHVMQVMMGFFPIDLSL